MPKVKRRFNADWLSEPWAKGIRIYIFAIITRLT
jgi:hypothetical protein